VETVTTLRRLAADQNRAGEQRRLDLALINGAGIAFAILLLQFLVGYRLRHEDQHREAQADHQSNQLKVGRENS
jgi:hypothetical protein